MPSLTVTPYEIRQILQIMLWIALPLTFIALLFVTFMHYYRKKKALVQPAYSDHPFEWDHPIDLSQVSIAGPTQDPGFSLLFRENLAGEEIQERRYDILKHQFSTLYKKYVEVLARNNDYDAENGGEIMDGLQNKVKDYESRIHHLQDELITLKNSNMENMDQAKWQEMFDQKEIEMHQLQAMIRQFKEDISLEKEQNNALVVELHQLQQHLKELEASAIAVGQDAGTWNQSLQQQLYEVGKKYDADKNEWMRQLQEMCTEVQLLKEENNALKKSLQENNIATISNITEDNRIDENISRAHSHSDEEFSKLRDRLFELEYLQDVVDEKKLQVDFLQNQLEQRIRSFHQLEHSHGDAIKEAGIFKATAFSLEQELGELKKEMEDHHSSMEELRDAFERSSEDNLKFGKQMEERSLYIEQLERKNQEWQQQHLHRLELLNSKDNIIADLNIQLSAQANELKEMQNELQRRNTLLSSLYADIGKMLRRDDISDQRTGSSLLGNENSSSQVETTTPEEFHLSEI